MKIGFTAKKVNPKLPCHLEGYEDRIATEVHDDLYVNTLYIEGNESFLFHVLDTIAVSKEFADQCRHELSEKFHIPYTNIFISSIHTHSAPKVSTVIDPTIPPDFAYLKLLHEAVLQNTEHCLQRVHECHAYFGCCELRDLFGNRNGKNLKNNNHAYLLQFRDENDAAILSMVNMACHPTILHADNLLVSSDYVGVLRKEYQKITGTPLIFFNGECGDVSTRFYRKSTGFAEVARVGKSIAKSLSNIESFRRIDLTGLSLKQYELVIDYNPKEDAFLKDEISRLDDVLASDTDNDKIGYANYLKSSLMRRYSKEHISLRPMTYVLESKDFRFVTIPGELVYELGHQLRSHDNKPEFICAYTNDYNYYAVNEAQYGKYFESYHSFYPKGKADEMIRETIKLFA